MEKKEDYIKIDLCKVLTRADQVTIGEEYYLFNNIDSTIMEIASVDKDEIIAVTDDENAPFDNGVTAFTFAYPIENIEKSKIIYKVEWQNYEDVECEGDYRIEKQEFYTKAEVAIERANRLDYEFTHKYDDDKSQIVEMDKWERWDQDLNYKFVVTKENLQRIDIKDLPGIKV